MDEKTIARFWAKVDKSGDCWIWTAYKTPKGYGQFRIGGRAKGRAHLSHRVAWAIANGGWPTLCVCHSCDNPACVNPAHLFLGTHAENMVDRDRKGRVQHGASHYLAKLTEGDIPTIRAALSAGSSKAAIAKDFGVSRATIRKVGQGKGWKHVSTDSEARGTKSENPSEFDRAEAG